MKTKDIYQQIKKYFSIEELVGRRTAKKYGQTAWRFLDPKALHALLIVREGIRRPITVNAGNRQQRGLRTNIQQIVRNKSLRNRLYISAHIQGKAFDFDIKGLSARVVRGWIQENAGRFPFKIRLEIGVSWVHLDTIWENKNPRVYLFKP